MKNLSNRIHNGFAKLKITLLCPFLFFSSISIVSGQLSYYGHSIPVNTAINSNTPLRILFVFAEVTGGCTTPDPYPNWQPGQIPTTAPQMIDNVPPVTFPPPGYLTRYFYEGSLGQYIVLGDYIDQVVSLPCSNYSDVDVIDAVNAGLGSTYTLHYNTPLQQFDNYSLGGTHFQPKPSTGDSQIDIVFVLWRNNPLYVSGGWGLVNGFFSPHSIGGFQINAGSAFPNHGYLTDMNFVIQEYLHGMYGDNNWHLGDGAGFHTFPFATNPWGVATQSAGAGMSNVVSGWDREFCSWYGWADLNQTIRKTNLISAINPNTGQEVVTDLQSPVPNSSTFVLRDFVTYGDAIKIKLPHFSYIGGNFSKNQYLWLENHQLITSFDQNFEPALTCKEPWASGLYAIKQVGKDVLSTVGGQPIEAFSPGDANFAASWMFPLTSNGNWDYLYGPQVTGPPNQICVWGNNNTPIKPCDPLTLANPFTGFSKIYGYFNSNGDNQLSGVVDNFSSSALSQYDCLNNLIYNWHSRGDLKTAFSFFNNNFKLSIASNPSTAPVYTLKSDYNLAIPTPIQHLEQYENRIIWLNGVSVEILQENVNPSVYGPGAVEVRVRFDDYDIDRDVRWCGEIKLSPHDFNSFLPSLVVKQGKTVLLDRGQSATHSYATGQISGQYVFTLPTVLSCLGNSKIEMEANSKIIVDNGSTLKLESSSYIHMQSGTEIRVKNGGKLILDPSSTIDNAGGRIIIENGATLEYTQASIHLATATSTLEIGGNLDLKTPASGTNVFSFTGDGYIKFNNPTNPTNNVFCGANCAIRFGNSNNNPLQKVIEVTQVHLKIPVGLVQVDFNFGKYLIAGGRVIQVLGPTTIVTMNNANFDWFNGYVHKGVQLYGQNSTVVSSSFKHGNYGIYDNQTTGGNSITVVNSVFSDCGTGLYTYAQGATIFGNDFSNCYAYGWYAQKMSQPCMFNYNTASHINASNGYAVHFDGNVTGSLWAEGNYIEYNHVGIEVQNAPFAGACNTVRYNDVCGVLIMPGATIDFSGGLGFAPKNEILDNAVSLWCGNAKNIFLADGYNTFKPDGSVVPGAIIGSIKRSCPPSAISVEHNEWNSTGTPPVSGTDYSVTTIIGQAGCTSAMPITLTDNNPIAFVDCSGSSSLIANGSPWDNCSTCDIINTPHLQSLQLDDAARTANFETTSPGGYDYLEAVRLFNELLMVNMTSPDNSEKYVLDMSYDKMLPALGRAFKTGLITEAENSTTLTIDVQRVLDVQNKIIAEAITNNDYFAQYYTSLDKAQTYRIAGRRDLAFIVLDDMFNWVQTEQADYLNYWSCTTHLEQDVLDGLIDYDTFITSIEGCGAGILLRTIQNNGTQTPGDAATIPSLTSGNSTSQKEKNAAKAIDKIDNQNIAISPNPATDKLYIYNAGKDVLTASLVDIYGKIVYKNSFINSQPINCFQFPRGIYFIEIKNAGGMIVKRDKVVLQ